MGYRAAWDTVPDEIPSQVEEDAEFFLRDAAAMDREQVGLRCAAAVRKQTNQPTPQQTIRTSLRRVEAERGGGGGGHAPNGAGGHVARCTLHVARCTLHVARLGRSRLRCKSCS